MNFRDIEIRSLDDEFLARVAEYRAMAASNDIAEDTATLMIGKLTIVYLDGCNEIVKNAEHTRLELKSMGA